MPDEKCFRAASCQMLEHIVNMKLGSQGGSQVGEGGVGGLVVGFQQHGNDAVVTGRGVLQTYQPECFSCQCASSIMRLVTQEVCDGGMTAASVAAAAC